MPRFNTVQLPQQSRAQQRQNKRDWNRWPLEKADFYTIGYEGRSIDELLERLIEAQVSTLIDVRFSPVSMYKPDFTKGNLRRHLEQHGIHYMHRPDLGVPREVRQVAVGKTDREDIWTWYRDYILPGCDLSDLYYFFNAMDQPVAIMCMEFDPTACHRHLLSQALTKSGLRGFDL